MLFNNPISPEKFDRLLDELWLSESSHVLEVGSGRGELLRRILTRFNCHVVAVEKDPSVFEKLKEGLSPFADKITLHNCAFQDCHFTSPSFDVCVSIGATHAFGDVGEALDKALFSLKNLTKPGGLILLGDGYWRKNPAPAYLEATGIDKNELRAHHENLEAGKKLGLECIYTIQASEDEWDHFEGAFWMTAEKVWVQNPQDEVARKTVLKRRNWKESYLKWGRETMGFALYVFLVPL